MSIEYTIDIQLTELGFPEVVQPRESSGREPRCRSVSPEDKLTPDPDSLTASRKQNLLLRVQQPADGKQTDAGKQTSDSKTPQFRPTEPAQTVENERVVNGSARDPTSGPPAATRPQVPPGEEEEEEEEQGADPAEMDEDSDNSEVSEVCEDEEDEFEDEEGGLDESSPSGDYRCAVCNLQLPSKFKLRDHMNLHTGARPYRCAECGKRFCQIDNYRAHLRTHAEAKVERLMCRVCRMGFTSQEELDDHLSSTHFEDQFYECDLCKHVFSSLKDCENHVQLHKYAPRITCQTCGRHFPSPRALAHHRRKRCHRLFKCTDCTLTFTKKNALLKHSFSHLGLLPYTCVRCRCHFRLAKLYRQHTCQPQRIHCVACLREFVCQRDFQQHKKDTGCWGNQENKTDEIRCLECGERFDTSDELKKHAGAHQRVLKCAECGKGFRSALLLMSHMGGHAGNSPCLCQSCGLGFPHQQNYDSHMKTCGQTPQPPRAPKKRRAAKSSSPERKMPNAKPYSPSPTETITQPGAPSRITTTTTAISSISTSSVTTSTGITTSKSALDTEAVPATSCSPDGLWKLTLNKDPPPGVNLLLFLPVCASPADGLTLPSTHLHPQHLGVNAALGLPLVAPLDFVTGIGRDPGCDVPLDLSKKCHQAVKGEPAELEMSGEADVNEGQGIQDSDASVELSSGKRETHAEQIKFQKDPMDLSSARLSTTSPERAAGIKEEPQSPHLDMDPSYQQMEKEIKLEVHSNVEKQT